MSNLFNYLFFVIKLILVYCTSQPYKIENTFIRQEFCFKEKKNDYFFKKY